MRVLFQHLKLRISELTKDQPHVVDVPSKTRAIFLTLLHPNQQVCSFGTPCQGSYGWLTVCGLFGSMTPGGKRSGIANVTLYMHRTALCGPQNVQNFQSSIATIRILINYWPFNLFIFKTFYTFIFV